MADNTPAPSSEPDQPETPPTEPSTRMTWRDTRRMSRQDYFFFIIFSIFFGAHVATFKFTDPQWLTLSAILFALCYLNSRLQRYFFITNYNHKVANENQLTIQKNQRLLSEKLTDAQHLQSIVALIKARELTDDEDEHAELTKQLDELLAMDELEGPPDTD